MSTPAPAITRRTTDRELRRRYLEAGGLVVVWMLMGLLLKLSTTGYVLIGIPLTLIFQRLNRRRPMRELWVRSERSAPRNRVCSSPRSCSSPRF
jgi:hypothetical protein